MTRAAAIGLLGMGLACLAAAATAQESDNRARLDDFAIPAASEPSRIDQLSPATTRVEPPAQDVDRALAEPPLPTKRSAAPAQLSSDADKGAPTQLSDAGSKDLHTAAVSSKADSKPGGVVHLKGHDRCDPQLDERRLAECRRILELRADEFHAPAPPQLSAEEKLLAEQRANEEAASRTPAQRLRLATIGDPDADLTSNQVLASIYLDTTNAPPEKPTDTLTPENPTDAAAILKAIGLDGAAPPQN